VLNFEILLLLLLVAALVQPLARRLDVPVAIAQVVCGLALSAVPLVAQVQVDPELAFTLFVPPLLFWASTTGSVRDVRRNARPILLLAVVLVLLTTLVVAVVARAFAPELPWASAFVLGAIVAPPDADVTTAIARRLGLSPRLVTILEGETLLNDTTAFVTYRTAVRAAVIGAFSLAQATGGLVLIAAGGVAVGWVVGWLLAQVTRLGADSLAATAFGSWHRSQRISPPSNLAPPVCSPSSRPAFAFRGSPPEPSPRVPECACAACSRRSPFASVGWCSRSSACSSAALRRPFGAVEISRSFALRLWSVQPPSSCASSGFLRARTFRAWRVAGFASAIPILHGEQWRCCRGPV